MKFHLRNYKIDSGMGGEKGMSPYNPYYTQRSHVFCTFSMERLIVQEAGALHSSLHFIFICKGFTSTVEKSVTLKNSQCIQPKSIFLVFW